MPKKKKKSQQQQKVRKGEATLAVAQVTQTLDPRAAQQEQGGAEPGPEAAAYDEHLAGDAADCLAEIIAQLSPEEQEMVRSHPGVLAAAKAAAKVHASEPTKRHRRFSAIEARAEIDAGGQEQQEQQEQLTVSGDSGARVRDRVGARQ